MSCPSVLVGPSELSSVVEIGSSVVDSGGTVGMPKQNDLGTSMTAWYSLAVDMSAR